MSQTDEEKVQRLKEFAKENHGKRNNALAALENHQKLLLDTQNKADTYSVCITSAAERHYLELLEIVERLDQGDLTDLYNLIGYYKNDLIHNHGFIVSDHPATGGTGSLFGPFSIAVKPVQSTTYHSFLLVDDPTDPAIVLRDDIEGCYCSLVSSVHDKYASVQILQAEKSNSLEVYGQTVDHDLINNVAYNTRLSPWSIHAPMAGRPTLFIEPGGTNGIEEEFNGDPDFSNQEGCFTFFFNLKHMNNKYFQYPADGVTGQYQEYGTGFPGVGFNVFNKELNDIAKSLIGQKTLPTTKLSYLSATGGTDANHFMGLIERQFAAESRIEDNFDAKVEVSGPGAFFIFCPKAYNLGNKNKFAQIGGKGPSGRIFNDAASYTGLIFCETGNIEIPGQGNSHNTLFDFTDDYADWQFPQIGQTNNSKRSWKHGTLDGENPFSVFPISAGAHDVYLSMMITNQEYSTAFDIYHYESSALAVYYFNKYLQDNYDLDLTDCIFIFLTNRWATTNKGHLPYNYDTEKHLWETTQWSGVKDFYRWPLDNIFLDAAWQRADDVGSGYPGLVTPNICFGSTQVIGFNTFGNDGITYNQYYSKSYNYPVLGSGGVPFDNDDLFFRQNVSSSAIENNDSLKLIERQQPIFQYILKDLSDPISGVTNTITVLEAGIPTLEANAKKYEDNDYESVTIDVEDASDHALDFCLFDNYTGTSSAPASVPIETTEEGSVKTIQGSLMTISERV